jgi:V/A-type H+-transporting ATPase subunit I
MIVPMKKCLVAMLAAEKPQGLKALRRLGLLHAEEVSGSGEVLDRAKAERDLLERAISALSTRKAAKKKKALSGDAAQALTAAQRMDELAHKERSLMERSAFLGKECDRIAVWGDFSPIDLRSLEESGRKVRLHALQSKPAPEFPEGVEAISLGGLKNTEYYLSFAAEGVEPKAMPESIALPEAGLCAMRDEISSIRKAVAEMNLERDALTEQLPAMQEALGRVKRVETFENLKSGMACDGPIAYLSGWVPAPELAVLQAEAAARGWALCDDDPADDEMPPTKTKNNALVRIIQPVFDFLGTVPNYREYDISAWFLIFFAIFFAMIFGDAGYGSLMFVTSVLLLIKAKASGRKPADFLFLLLLLSTTTLIWGTITGSWFSLPAKMLPAFLTASPFPVIPALASWNPASTENVQVLCFTIGMIQLLIAHVKNIIRDFPKPKFLAQIGNFAMVLGLFFVVLNLVIDAKKFPLQTWHIAMVGGGFLVSFVFANYDKNILQSILDGFKNIISAILGTVSYFADIVSYIRLWAVGMAGVAIAQTVNGMVGGLFTWTGSLWRLALGILVGAVGLGFGHGLNLIMNVLSVVVHGVRLNMLEFSGHLGMEWSGYKYEPFAGPEEEGSEAAKESK